jgi:hypothetical protein
LNWNLTTKRKFLRAQSLYGVWCPFFVSPNCKILPLNKRCTQY